MKKILQLKKDAIDCIITHWASNEDLAKAPKIFVKGEGCYLYDIEGNKYLDTFASLLTTICGHGREEVVAAAEKQMRVLEFFPNYHDAFTLPLIELARKLKQIAPGDLGVSFFVNSGSEANEGAFKLARFYWHLRGQPKKEKVICRREAYHGGTLATTSATGMPVFWRGFGPLPPEFVRVGTCYCYHCEWGKTYPGCGLECAGAVEETILREGPDTVAAFIAEPVMGAGGVIVPPATAPHRVRWEAAILDGSPRSRRKRIASSLMALVTSSSGKGARILSSGIRRPAVPPARRVSRARADSSCGASCRALCSWRAALGRRRSSCRAPCPCRRPGPRRGRGERVSARGAPEAPRRTWWPPPYRRARLWP
ncbi:hypothetical protein LCGC14_2710150 [marine sediment metagenome]|uniref:Aminotransferase class III-fold pyridoxal phosphate-dependent enzyme n=1 Tax=marine sediment metagenome TaxID=412755 RepID=A0A0F8ZD33_9ZZZZ